MSFLSKLRSNSFSSIAFSMTAIDLKMPDCTHSEDRAVHYLTTGRQILQVSSFSG